MQIEMYHVETHVPGTDYAHHGVEIGAVVIKKTARGMYDLRYGFDIFIHTFGHGALHFSDVVVGGFGIYLLHHLLGFAFEPFAVAEAALAQFAAFTVIGVHVVAHLLQGFALLVASCTINNLLVYFFALFPFELSYQADNVVANAT